MTSAERPAHRRRYRLWILLVAVVGVAITVIRSRLRRPSVPTLVESPYTTPAAGAEPVLTAPVADAAPAADTTSDPESEPEPEIPAGKYGPGSAGPLAGGASPHPSFTIKGNADSMLYHPPESPYFKRTIAEQWFVDEAAAQAAGFLRWNDPNRPRRGGSAPR